MTTTPDPKTVREIAQVWFYEDDDEACSPVAYTTAEAAQVAALSEVDPQAAGPDADPELAAHYGWHQLEGLPRYFVLKEDGQSTGYKVCGFDVVDGAGRAVSWPDEPPQDSQPWPRAQRMPLAIAGQHVQPWHMQAVAAYDEATGNTTVPHSNLPGMYAAAQVNQAIMWWNERADAEQSHDEREFAWHELRRFSGPHPLDGNDVDQHELTHPEQCSILPPGAACWAEYQPFRWWWPTAHGTYRIRPEDVLTGGSEDGPDWNATLRVQVRDEAGEWVEYDGDTAGPDPDDDYPKILERVKAIAAEKAAANAKERAERDAQLADLATELDAANDNADEIADRAGTYRKEIMRLRARIRELEAAQDERNARIAELEREVRELRGTELNPSPLVLDAQAYGELRDEIAATMGDGWDLDEAEISILIKYVRWLAAGQPRDEDGYPIRRETYPAAESVQHQGAEQDDESDSAAQRVRATLDRHAARGSIGGEYLDADVRAVLDNREMWRNLALSRGAEREQLRPEYGIRADFTDTTSAEFTVAETLGDALAALDEFDTKHGQRVVSRELVQRPVGTWRKVDEHGER